MRRAYRQHPNKLRRATHSLRKRQELAREHAKVKDGLGKNRVEISRAQAEIRNAK